MKTKREIVSLIILGIACLTFFYIIAYKWRDILIEKADLPRTIEIETISKIKYNKDDYIFIQENQELFGKGNVSIWAVTSEGDKELIKIKYSGQQEDIKYRQYGHYIYFWLNGNRYDSMPSDNAKLKKEMRMQTDAQLYKYDIDASTVEKIEIENSDKTVIIDILYKNGEELIVKEVARVQTSYGKWESLNTFVGNEKYNFTVTNYYWYDSKGLATADKVIIPIYKGVIIESNNKLEEKDIYSEKNPYAVELYEYEESILCMTHSRLKEYITAYDNNFLKQREIEITHKYPNYLKLEDKVIIYGWEKGLIKISYLDLKTWQTIDLGIHNINEDISFEDISLKYNAYTKTLVFYNNGTLETVLDYHLYST